MSIDEDSPNPDEVSVGWFSTLLICLIIVAVGGGLLYLIYNTEPTARRSAGAKETAMLVNVTRVDTGTYRPRIDVMGTVQPSRDIVLQPRISGQVIDRSENFTPGGFVEQGEELLQVDPADYRNELQQAESDLLQARSELKIEMGRQDVAQEEYQLLDENLTEENRSLVLRRPQLESARARVESAQAGVDQAQLNLERTSVEAPFNAQVLNRNANVGSQVSTGENLARLVGLETYWVETTVPLSKLRWLSFPEEPGETGSTVRIRDRSAWPENVYRTGRLYQLVGELEDQARMARVLINVNDPLARRETTGDSPQLLIGSFVEAQIHGRQLENVVRLNREYVRDDETVWIMNEGKLDIRDVTVTFEDEDHAFIKSGLSAGEKVVTTNLATVVDGAPLRVEQNTAARSGGSM